MNDQAENLRRKLEMKQTDAVARTLAVLSGKGGVGKSNFSLNFSISLSMQQKKVLLFDMDIGMGNIDILIGQHSAYSIVDFFENRRRLDEIITEGPEGISIITGGTGLTHLFTLDEEKFSRFQEEFLSLLKRFDYIVFDMGAGITEDSAKFLFCVDELIVVTTPEPTSVMDAYSTIKYIQAHKEGVPFFLVCNRVFTNKEGKETIMRIQNALRKFLGFEAVALGYIPDDKTVSKAVSKQVPFLLSHPGSAVSQSITEIAKRYMDHAFGKELSIQKSNFLRNMKRYFLGK